MAIKHYSYCNASLGKTITIDFDETLLSPTYLQIVGHTIGGNCNTPEPVLIASINPLGIGVVGSLIPMNVAPYAQYVDYNSGSDCSDFVLTSIVPGDATNNLTSDGSLIINVSGGRYITEFTISGPSGVFTQNTFINTNAHIFTGLKPGVYSVVVNTQHFSLFGSAETCTVQDEVTVGFSTLICDIGIGSVTTESATGSNNGKIKVVNLTGYQAQVEYRLDAGAWQDSAEFTGLVADTYLLQVRYKDYPSCGDSRNIEVLDDDSCDALINDVIILHEQTKYSDDGAIQVVASSSQLPIQYSINDGVDYQDSNYFINLQPGTYLVRIIDAGGCEDNRTVEVFKYKKPFINFPVVNSHRFVLINSPTIRAGARQNFDNRLFGQMTFPDSEAGCYHEKVENTFINTIQLQSNYSKNTLRIYNEAGVIQSSMLCTKKTEHLNKVESFPAQFTPLGGGKLQVFFEFGIPVFVEAGMDIAITDNVTLNGTYEIEDILPGIGLALGYQVLIITAPVIVGVQTGTSTFEYDVEPYEAYEAKIEWALFPVGKYYMTVEGVDAQFQNYLAQSEPVESKATWKNCILITYKDYDNSYQIIYETGIIHKLLVEGVFKWPDGGGERTVYKDSRTRTIKLEEFNTRNPKLYVKYLPPYLLEKLKLAFAHDYFTVEEVEYQCEEDFSIEWLEGEALHHGNVKLVQVDFQNENSDDQGQDVDSALLDINDTLLSIDI